MRAFIILVTVLASVAVTALFVPLAIIAARVGDTFYAWLMGTLVVFVWLDAGIVCYLTKEDE